MCDDAQPATEQLHDDGPQLLAFMHKFTKDNQLQLQNMTKQIANDQKQHRESITTHINKINDNLVKNNLNDTTSTNNQFNNSKFNYTSRNEYNNQHRNFNNNNKDKSSFSKHNIRVCYECGSTDHFKRNCPKVNKQYVSKNSQQALN